ncbi:hypothetical protein OAF56_01575 [Pirellulaceae bacterium]|nr:hypothetical protein [Pirellulaceae bacterium]
MAVTEKNQWLHILLILFVILAVAGSVTTYLSVTSAYESAAKAKTQTDEAKKQTEIVKVAEELTGMAVAFSGVPGVDAPTIDEAKAGVESIRRSTANFDALQSQFLVPAEEMLKIYESDMKDAPQGVETWRSLATYLVNVVNSKNKTIQEKDDQNARTKAEADTKVKEAETERDTAVTAKNKAESDLAAEQQKYAADIKKLNDQLASLTQSTADNNRKFSSDVQKEQEERKKLASVINVQKTTIEKQSDIISTLTRTDFEIPDGRITSVNGATKIVWLNLGYLDALPNQIKFNVYDSQAAAFDENAKKGEIKIQRIVGPHTAEAIIIEKDNSNPILPDDFIFTPTWTPGQRTKYYLAGKFDLDGDGKSDQERVKALLKRSGGEIVGELLQDGTKAGNEIDPYVRYLVYGGKPDNATLSLELDKIRQKANAEGVKVISFDLLLTNLGLGSEARVISGGVEKKNSFAPRRPKTATFGN